MLKKYKILTIIGIMLVGSVIGTKASNADFTDADCQNAYDQCTKTNDDPCGWFNYGSVICPWAQDGCRMGGAKGCESGRALCMNRHCQYGTILR